MVDASRARLFTYERTAEATGLQEQLTEERDLVNPARRLRPSALFTEAGPGVSRSGSLQYGFDDHRDEHVDEMDAAFSRLVTEELASLLRASPANRVILCASPKMLGELRGVGRALRREVPFDEVPRDLVKLTPPQLRDQLASYGLLPNPPRRPGLT